MRFHHLLAVGLFASTTFNPALAIDVGVASFNLAWAGSSQDFARHADVCSAAEVNWCDTRAKVAKGAVGPTAEEDARAKRCQTAVENASGGRAQALLVAPCNAYKLSAKKLANGGPKLYSEKLEGLRATISQLVDKEHVDVIAFQEVRSQAVIEEVLGKHVKEFESCVAAHTAFQTVGFAWRKTLSEQPGQCVSEPSLAVKEDLLDAVSRTVRPGLELNLKIGGKPASFLNVHLKSACANLVTGGGFPGRELTDADPSCRILNRQISPLENWIERTAHSAPRFVVLGDFNRRLDEEAKLTVAPNMVRTDGTDPSGPNTMAADGRVSSRFLWQEIADGNPVLHQIPLSQASSTCKGFTGLDHILISEALLALQVAPLSSVKIPVVQKPQQVIITSDHCPRLTKLVM